MNLLSKLKEVAEINAKQSLKESEDILSAVKENLQSETNADLDMLKHFGTKTAINENLLKKKNANEIISGAYLMYGDIEKICKRYNLRFLPPRLYVNEVPIKALNDLRIYSESHNFSTRNLMIIAPRSHFALTQKPKVDPILLYNEGDNKYKIISTWGNDLSDLRRATTFLYYHWPAILCSLFITITCSFFLHFHDGLFAFIDICVFILTIFIWGGRYTGCLENWNKPFKS